MRRWTVTLALLFCAYGFGAEKPMTVSKGSANVNAISMDKPLTLDQCIAVALQHHGRVLAANARYKSAEARIVTARSPLFPQIITRHTFFRGQTIGRQTGFIFRRLGFITETKQWSVYFDILLFDSGLTQAQIEQAKASAEGAKQDLNATLNSIALTVTQAYFELLRAQHLLKLSQQQLEASQAHLRMVQARIQAGDAAPVDVHPVRVEVANARLSLLSAQNQVKVARTALANAMGLNPHVNIDVVDVPEPQPQPLSMTLQACLDVAVKNRPDLLRARSELQLARAGLRAARLQTMPVLNVNAGYEIGIGGYSPTQRRWQIDASISFPIFDGGATQARLREAKANMQAARASYEQLMRDIQAEVEQAYLNLQNAWERITATRTVVEEAERNLEAAREKYRLGLGIIIEVVDAQVNLFNAHINQIQATYDYYIAEAQLRYATGEIAKHYKHTLMPAK